MRFLYLNYFASTIWQKSLMLTISFIHDVKYNNICYVIPTICQTLWQEFISINSVNLSSMR